MAVSLAKSLILRDLIHFRCGHLHEDGILKLDKLGADGMLGFRLLTPLSFYAECANGKSSLAKINRSSTRDKDPPTPFHTVALDTRGPMSTEYFKGNKWFLGGVCYKTSTAICRGRHEAQVRRHRDVESYDR